MRVDYQFTAREFLACLRHLRRRFLRTSGALTAVRVQWLLAAACLLGLAYLSLNDGSGRLPLSVALAALAFALVLGGRVSLQRRYANRMIAADGIFTQPRSLQIDEDGITIDDRLSTSRYLWDAVRDVEEAKSHVYIHIDNIPALIVPKRAFASEEDCRHFVDQAKVWARLA